ncbi:right-handed parallel beta-helix repeat-containing protein [Arenicella xantha]|uniref:Parallel beta-helix repeat protein n=1 Tax=Arenicella xantha TaxID=644221 RepID=A0A395JK09_9GAMM|nr:right-handed parallel beta-helix repeat-containing protein [Arenicella xantha]RBP51062.1 parallel beta-helix repeat protein [Arenicella xantha]
MKSNPTHLFLLTACALIYLSGPGVSLAANFYIDPINGDSENSGTQAAPWRTLQQVIEDDLIESHAWRRPYYSFGDTEPRNQGAPVKAGDTLILMSGYHGKVNIHKYVNTSTIHVKAGAGQTPTLSQLHFQASANWSVSGLTISPIYGDIDESSLLRIESNSFNGPSHNITVQDNELFSATDVSNWSVANWLERRKSGISVDADNSLIANNTIRNIAFGITVSSDNVTVRNNRVINFSGDALRGLGNYGLFEYNFVANAFKVDGNHDDGFQSWSRDGKPVVGMTLRGNEFYTNYNHPNPALLSNFQGIGCFDGFYNNWLIENNLVAVSHWHGISVYGANNTRIINNTVVDDPRHTDDPMVPWIRLTTHKNNTHGINNVVRNNIGKLASTTLGVTLDHNFDPGVAADDHSNYLSYFRSPLNFDYRLKRTAPPVGAGSEILAPNIDITGRLRNKPFDVGAYAFQLIVLPFLPLIMED